MDTHVNELIWPTFYFHLVRTEGMCVCEKNMKKKFIKLVSCITLKRIITSLDTYVSTDGVCILWVRNKNTFLLSFNMHAIWDERRQCTLWNHLKNCSGGTEQAGVKCVFHSHNGMEWTKLVQDY